VSIRNLRTRLLWLMAAGLAAALLGLAQAEAASTITVDTLTDADDDGKCSLQEALEAANTDSKVDACAAGDGDAVINISVKGTIEADDLTISSNVTVQGNADGTTINGADFDIIVSGNDESTTEADSVTAVTLADLTIADATGEAGVYVADDSEGAVDAPYTVTLENLRIYDSGMNGVLFFRSFDSTRPGHVYVKDSVMEGNGGAGVEAYACDATSVGVVMTVTNSIMRDNTDPRFSVGARNTCGHLRIIDSTITGNEGSAVYASAGNWISDTDNDAKASTLTEIINTTITGNNTTNPDIGGGVYLERADGFKPSLSIVHSTIVGNTSADGIAGGIRAEGDGPMSLSIANTVVADNSGAQCGLGAVDEPDTGGGVNASSDESCGFSRGGVKPNLKALADNGGAAPLGPNGGMGNILTMAVNDGSPLLGAADSQDCLDADARGVVRPHGDGCDIGAYQATAAERTPRRIGGSDRYSTAAEISKATFGSDVDAVYIATGANFPDALAGSAASGGVGPILLVTKDAVGGPTTTELKRLKPKKIVVLGGTGVVSQAVESKLKEHTTGEVTRQAGSDRYSTAAAISAKHFDPGAPVAYVATGEDFPDALTGGPAAAELGGPILLAQKTKLPQATVAELKRLKPKEIVVLGGTGVVSETVEKALADHTSGKVSRLAGADRYSTGATISKEAFEPGAPFAYIATGLNYPDALAGGAAGALKDGPVLLVTKTAIPKATKDELTRLKPKRIIVLGGTGAVPDSLMKDLTDYIIR